MFTAQFKNISRVERLHNKHTYAFHRTSKLKLYVIHKHFDRHIFKLFIKPYNMVCRRDDKNKTENINSTMNEARRYNSRFNHG